MGIDAPDVLSNDIDLKSATILKATTFASALALADGKGGFALRALPAEAQLAPINAAVAADVDGDGHQDVVVAGNFHGVQPIEGRYDASQGLVLLGDGAGALRSVEMTMSGMNVQGQVRHMTWLRGAKGDRLLLVARNNDALQVLRLNTARAAGIAKTISR